MSCEYPVDHILQGERELKHFTGDEVEPEATVIEQDDAGPPVAVQLLDTARAAVLDRHRVYGPPQEHFARTVGMVNSLFASVLRRPLTTADWARIMLLDKLARDLGPRPPVGSPRLTVFRRPVSSQEEHRTTYAIGAVRNVALQHVQRIGFVGWMAFLDDDDEWMPEKMARQFAAVGSNTRYGVVCSNAYNRSPSGLITGYHHELHGVAVTENTRDVTALLREFNPVINSTAMVKTSVAERIGVQKPSERWEDYDYWRRATKLTGILRVEEPLAWYTVGNAKEYR